MISVFPLLFSNLSRTGFGIPLFPCILWSAKYFVLFKYNAILGFQDTLHIFVKLSPVSSSSSTAPIILTLFCLEYCSFTPAFCAAVMAILSRLCKAMKKAQTSEQAKPPLITKSLTRRKVKCKYSSVFRDSRCPPPPKPIYGGNFNHKAVTLKIRSRSPKSNTLLILSDLYRLANLVTFHPMVHEITCRQTLFG